MRHLNNGVTSVNFQFQIYEEFIFQFLQFRKRSGKLSQFIFMLSFYATLLWISSVGIWFFGILFLWCLCLMCSDWYGMVYWNFRKLMKTKKSIVLSDILLSGKWNDVSLPEGGGGLYNCCRIYHTPPLGYLFFLCSISRI